MNCARHASSSVTRRCRRSFSWVLGVNEKSLLVRRSSYILAIPFHRSLSWFDVQRGGEGTCEAPSPTDVASADLRARSSLRAGGKDSGRPASLGVKGSAARTDRRTPRTKEDLHAETRVTAPAGADRRDNRLRLGLRNRARRRAHRPGSSRRLHQRRQRRPRRRSSPACTRSAPSRRRCRPRGRRRETRTPTASPSCPRARARWFAGRCSSQTSTTQRTSRGPARASSRSARAVRCGRSRSSRARPRRRLSGCTTALVYLKRGFVIVGTSARAGRQLGQGARRRADRAQRRRTRREHDPGL